MISSTDFIPVYSELFSFIEEKYGESEVERFWNYLFKPDGKGIPLINFLEKEGLKGCYSYWSGSLNEEAADFSMYLNEKDGWFKLKMHHCPSKGRLLKLKDEIGVVPYHRYCMHCDHYRESVEKAGLKYIYDFCSTDTASCSLLIYDPEKFTEKLVVDAGTLQMHRNAADNEYYHKDFHSSMNNGIEYLGEKYGEAAVCEFLRRVVKNVYKKEIANIKKHGIDAIIKIIEDTYNKEKCLEVLNMIKDSNKVSVSIDYCPAVKHLSETGRSVSKWFFYTTSVIMKEFAKTGNLKFEIKEYNSLTGKTNLTFSK